MDLSPRRPALVGSGRSAGLAGLGPWRERPPPPSPGGDLGQHPRILGAVGRGARGRCGAEAQGAGCRCLGLAPMAEWCCVTLVASAMGTHLFGAGGGTARTPCRRRAGPPGRSLRVEAAQAGDLVGRLRALRPAMVAGHVDVVRPSERLAEHVVDAGLLEDGGRRRRRSRRYRGRRLQHDAAGAGLADHRVHDGAAGEGHGEEVLAGLLGALLDGERYLMALP